MDNLPEIRSHYELNELGQPVNNPVSGWVPPPVPERRTLDGRFCRVEPLDPATHAESLWVANSQDREGRMWTYVRFGPFETFEGYRAWLEERYSGPSSPYAIVDAVTGHAVGIVSYTHINPSAGSIEVGSVVYSPMLQGTSAATEAMYLMMQNAFSLGYRRYEWQCNTLNATSRAAAQRLGFSFEGVFRQENVIRGRNRDQAWYSVIDQEWPALRAVFQQWLAPENFDLQGQQRTRLSDLTRPLLNDIVIPRS
jgi:RimJ/RimL family protein N-acetyltransferase